MNRITAIAVLLVISAASRPATSRQDQPAPKAQVILRTTMFSTVDDLWLEVKEVDPTLQSIGVEVGKLAKALESDAIGDRNKAAAALKHLGLPAFAAIREVRNSTKSDQARWELDSILSDLAGGWPGVLPRKPLGRPLTRSEGIAVRAEVTKMAKGLEAEAIEDRSKATDALKNLGPTAYGAILEERDKATSESVRRGLDSLLKEFAGPSIGVPFGKTLSRIEGATLRKKLTELKLRTFHSPSMNLVDGQPGSIFIGDEIPAGAGRRRVRLDADGKKLTLEEKAPARMLKFGFQMVVKPEISGKERLSASLEIAITSSHIRRPLREIETPLGLVSDPEVIEIGIDLIPVLESGQHYIAGPFPSAQERTAPSWILIEAEVIKP